MAGREHDGAFISQLISGAVAQLEIFRSAE